MKNSLIIVALFFLTSIINSQNLIPLNKKINYTYENKKIINNLTATNRKATRKEGKLYKIWKFSTILCGTMIVNKILESKSINTTLYLPFKFKN